MRSSGNCCILPRYALCFFILILIGTGCFSEKRKTVCNIGKTSTQPNLRTPTDDNLNKLINSVYIHNDYAYIGTSTSFEIVNISNPRNPELVKQILMSVDDISMIDNYAFVSGEGLRIFDLTDPNNPIEVFCVDNPSFQLSNVNVVGATVFSLSSSDGLQVLDISNPTSIATIGNYQSQTVPRLQFDSPPYLEKSRTRIVTDVEIYDHYAFVSENLMGIDSYYDGLIRIIDVSNPQNLTIINTLKVNVGIQNLLINQNYLFVSTSYLDSPSLLIFDISDPIIPIEVKTPLLPSGFVAVNEHFVFFSTPNGLQVWDLTNPSDPVKSVWDNLHFAFIRDFEISDNYAYIGTQYGGLKIVDITDPYNPVTISTIFD